MQPQLSPDPPDLLGLLEHPVLMARPALPGPQEYRVSMARLARQVPRDRKGLALPDRLEQPQLSQGRLALRAHKATLDRPAPPEPHLQPPVLLDLPERKAIPDPPDQLAQRLR